MSLSAKIREQLISSFRAELAEHVQVINDGLLALEQGQVAGGARVEMLENVFRAAHSLKGAARAVGVSTVEQLAHALEDVLGGMQTAEAFEPTPGLFNACYRALDAIQLVQSVYESGGTSLPPQVLQALSDMEAFRHLTPDQRPTTDADQRSAVSSQTPAHSAQPAAIGQAPNSNSPRPVGHGGLAEPGDRQSLIPNSPSLTSDETIRVSTSKLDALMAQLSELLVTKIHAEQRLLQVRQAQTFMAAWQKEWLTVRGEYSRLARNYQDVSHVSVDMQARLVEKKPGDPDGRPNPAGAFRQSQELARLLGYVDSSQERLREMGALINALAREYANDTMQMSLVIDRLEEEIKRVRMLPLATITATFGRMVRDLAQTAGKEVVLEIKGAEVELDKHVLEQIKDPLIHLLRNAIDHGLESPEERGAAGKPRAGVISLAAEQLGKDVVICVSDDGAGLDVEKIRQTAERKGYADAKTLSDAELVMLIFSAGFSTSPIITDVSGRGVGLDVVRRNVEVLHGRLGVDWTPGQGSTFTLTLPLALTSSRGLMVCVSGQLFAIPLNFIERILHVSSRQIESLGGHDTLRYNSQDSGRQERALTMVHLGDVLGLPRVRGNGKQDDLGIRRNGQPDEARVLPVVILSAERRMAFAVDELAGEQEIVIKGLGRQLVHVGGVAGASVMGNGEVLLVLSVSDLIKLALHGEHRSVFAPARPVAEESAGGEPIDLATPQHALRRVLVVDDSITTRTLEKNILEAAGYSVQLATDGQEALGLIAAGVPDLIVSDIAMPRLDGFGLTQRIKAEPRTSGVPVILVTSLDSPADKARGIEVGADAYIIKSSFDQNNLLETIEQLI